MTDGGKEQRPRARKQGLLIERLPDEVLVYDLDRKKAHCLNGSAALIWNHCDGKTSVEGISRILQQQGLGVVNDDVGVVLHLNAVRGVNRGAAVVHVARRVVHDGPKLDVSPDESRSHAAEPVSVLYRLHSESSALLPAPANRSCDGASQALLDT